MKTFQNAFEAGKWAPGAVVAIGKFDGLHLGHQRLIAAAVARAKETGRKCLVLTFDPSPEVYLGRGLAIPILPIAKRLEMMKDLGVEGVVLLPFSKTLACQAPEAFVRDVLAAQLKASDIFVGEDFCFGKDRAGRVETLQELGPKMGFATHAVRLVKKEGDKIAASRIRELIDAGKIDAAERLLGWKFSGK